MRIGLNARALDDNHFQRIDGLSLIKRDFIIALTNFKAPKTTEFDGMVVCAGDYETTFYTNPIIIRASTILRV